MDSSSISMAINGPNCVLLTFDTIEFAPGQELIREIRDEIREKRLDVVLDASKLGHGILAFVVGATSAVGYAVVGLIDHVIERIKAWGC